MSSKLAAFTLENDLPHTPKMPVLFVGHGSPMNAINENKFHQKWKSLGEELTKPSAILVISAHWLSSGSTQVMATPNPETIYDFGGFPQKLFDQKYPAPGHKKASELTQSLLQGRSQSGFKFESALDHSRGFDHGTWSVLLAMYPKADIPVFQLSIDMSKPAEYHYDVGKQLAALRERGVLIMGSGNLVHNLYAMASAVSKPFDWALELDTLLADAMSKHDDKPLLNASRNHPTIMKNSHPTLEHYYPLLYALGAKSASDKVEFFNNDFVRASISMRSVIYS